MSESYGTPALQARQLIHIISPHEQVGGIFYSGLGFHMFGKGGDQQWKF